MCLLVNSKEMRETQLFNNPSIIFTFDRSTARSLACYSRLLTHVQTDRQTDPQSSALQQTRHLPASSSQFTRLNNCAHLYRISINSILPSLPPRGREGVVVVHHSAMTQRVTVDCCFDDS